MNAYFIIAMIFGAALVIGFTCAVVLPLMGRRYRHALFSHDAIPTVLLPNASIQGKNLEKVYGHPSANLKQGSVFRNFVKYIHHPVDIHQENIDEGDLYVALSKATSRILSLPDKQLSGLVQFEFRSAAIAIHKRKKAIAVSRLRSLFIPVAIRIFHRILFKEACSREAELLLVANIIDFMETLHALRPKPDLALRERVQKYLETKLQQGGYADDFFGEDSVSLKLEDKAKHLQGVFFHTGVFQICDLVSHCVIEIDKHPAIRAQLEDPATREKSLDNFITETLRLFPLFGVTNRITGAAVDLGSGPIAAGTQFLFDFQTHHRHGYEEPDRMLPERWNTLNKADQCYMPFGKGARRCPAEHFSLAVVKEALKVLVDALRIYTPVAHHRALEGGVLCAVAPRGAHPKPYLVAATVCSLSLVDRVDTVLRNLKKFLYLPRLLKAAGEKFPQRQSQSLPAPKCPVASDADHGLTCPFGKSH